MAGSRDCSSAAQCPPGRNEGGCELACWHLPQPGEWWEVLCGSFSAASRGVLQKNRPFMWLHRLDSGLVAER